MDATVSRRQLLQALSMTGGGALCASGARTVGAHSLQSAAEKELNVPLPAVQQAAIARRIVRALQPADGERAVLVYDPSYYGESARTIQAELHRAGVYPVVALTFEPLEVLKGRSNDGARSRQDRAVEFLRPLFEQSQIFLWLPARGLEGDSRWEHLIDNLPIRGIHFHWIFGPLASRSAENIETLSRMYERAILDLDYAALSRQQDALIARLRGQEIRITNPDGTRLTMRVPATAWFHKSDGDASPARMKLATAVRDREIEFPAGALRFVPDAASVEGTLVVRHVPGIAESVTLEFSKGRVVTLRADINEAAFRKTWEGFGGDIDKVGEIVLGVNPLLTAELPSGEVPYAGFGSGALRVSMGDNWESGGSNRTKNGRPLWLFPRQVTVEAGGRPLVTQGTFSV